MPRPTLIRILLFVVVLAVFARAGSSEFVNWDDFKTISKNPSFNPPTWESLAGHWERPHNHMYIPVVYSMWWMLAQGAQIPGAEGEAATLNPWIYHAANVLMHAANVLLVFTILRRLVKKDWAAAAGALLFALHPLQVEPVAWATGMKDLLLGFFTLSSLWLYICYAEASKGGAKYYAWGVVCFVLAMLCKPTAIVTPVIAGAVDYLLLRRRPRQVIAAVVPWLVLALPVVFVTNKLLGNEGFGTPAPVWQRPLVAGDTVAFYLYKLVAPVNLNIDYGRTPEAIFQNGWAYWTWLAPAALFMLLLWARKPMLSAAGLIFLLPLLPVSGLVPFSFQYFSTVADRYAYIPMVGAALASAWGLSELKTPRAAVFAAVPLALLAGLSVHQIGYWHNDAALFDRVLALNPKSIPGWRATARMDVVANNLPQAIIDMQKAIEVRPNYPESHDDLAKYLIAANRPQEGGDQLVMGARLNYMLTAGDLVGRGKILSSMHRDGEAVEMFERALQKDPENAEASEQLELAKARLKAPATRANNP